MTALTQGEAAPGTAQSGAPAANDGKGDQTPAPPAPGTQPGAPQTPQTPEAPKPGESKPDEKPPDGQAAAPPTDIPLTFPEGVKVDEALLGKFKPLAQKHGLKSEAAQELVNLYVEQQTAQAQAQQAEAERTHQAWVDSLKADKEIGGQAFDGSLKAAQKAMTRFATPELRTLLNESGLGNHPELVRFVTRVGRALAEDSIGGATHSPMAQRTLTPEEKLRVMYPTMYSKES